jgi:hypothetical protein
MDRDFAEFVQPRPTPSNPQTELERVGGVGIGMRAGRFHRAVAAARVHPDGPA